MKRKRDDAENDPKLKEFLEVYQPPSKTNIWTDGDAQVAAGTATADEPVQDIVIEADESDDEYQVIAKRPKTAEAPKESPTEMQSLQVVEPVQISEIATVEDVDAPMEDVPDASASGQGPTTDDDWLRSRTNRLLDLVEDDDVPVAPVAASSKSVTEKRDSPVAVEQEPEPTQPENAPVVDAAPSEEDKIRETGRLYLRNLHFEVTEEDIRNQFSKYGSLDEVSHKFPFISTRFRMNVKIGTTDAKAFEVTL